MSEWLDQHTPLLVIGETGDCYFVGDLDAGRALIQRDRFAYEGDTNGRWWVALCDDLVPDDENPIDHGSVAEWGVGETVEEAWRYALGAAMGPLDAEYDETALRTALNEFKDVEEA